VSLRSKRCYLPEKYLLIDLCASSYSGPFASQWIWCLVILVGLPFAPESPWFLIRKGRFDEAESALRRLASKKVDVKPAMAMMIEVSEIRSGWAQEKQGILSLRFAESYRAP